MYNSAKRVASLIVIATVMSTSIRPVSTPAQRMEVHLGSQRHAIDNEPYHESDMIPTVKERMDNLPKDLIAKRREQERLTKKKEDEERAILEQETKEIAQESHPQSRGGNPTRYLFLDNFRLTAYNLSEDDCEKGPDSPYFGIASSGYDFNGKDLTCRKIAVDPKVIPMGSTVYIEFNEEYNNVTLPNGTQVELSGSYQAVDVGGAIKGNKIDLFVGGLDKGIIQLCNEIGVRQVKVYLTE